MTRMRICEVIKTLDVGGAEVLLVERLQRAPKRDKDYTVVCLRASTSELITRLKTSGITVVDLASCYRPLVYWRLMRTVSRLAPDVLNVHSPLPASVLRPFLRLRRRRPRIVSTVHMAHQPTTVLADRVKTALTMICDRLTRGLDDQTVAVSTLVARSPAVRGSRRVLTRVHGVDVAQQRYWAERSDVVRREFHVPDGAFLVVCVANFRPQKNHRMLIQAAAEVLNSRSDALFILAGDGPLHDEIVRETRRRGLQDRVRTVGHVRQARRLIAAADLVVLSSHYEGLPVVVMEALAAGVPVVSTNVGGLADLIDPGVNGILTEPGSPHALAAGVLRAMSPSAHRGLRSGAAASAERVDMAGTAEWFDGLYNELDRASRTSGESPESPLTTTEANRKPDGCTKPRMTAGEPDRVRQS